MVFIFRKVLLLSLLPLLVSCYYVKVGILTHDLNPETTQKLWSMGQNFSTMMSLEPIVQESQWREHDAAGDLIRSVCKLVNKGVDALVFFGPSQGTCLVSSYSTYLGLPFIAAVEMGENCTGKYQVSMLPDTTKAAADFILHSGGWDRFIFFYDSYEGPERLQKLLGLLAHSEFIPQIDGFWKTPDVKTAVMYIKELIPHNVIRRIVLSTSEEFADGLANELSLLGSISILLLTPVGTIQKPPTQRRYMYTITKFSMIEDKDPFLVILENRLKTLPSFYARGRTTKNVPDSVILHYDSSTLLNTMFNQIRAK